MPALPKRSTWCCLALLILGQAGAGCGKRLRGIEIADQVLLRGGKSVLQEADGIEAVVTPVRVPWASKGSPIGFAVELTNHTDGYVYLAIGEVELHDSAGRIFDPMPPERLLRSFGIEVDDGRAVQTAGYGRRHVRRYSYRHHHPRYARYRWHRGYPYGHSYYGTAGWSVGGFGFGGEPDPYADQRETARFLSELLTDQAVAPRHVAYGHVVFAHRLEEDEQLTLVIRVVHESAPPTSQPAESVQDADGEAARVTSLVFRFEVD